MAVLDTAPALAECSLALARRFAAGATLWCWSPSAPHHAHHVAVEFVHPVVVGARALPAAELAPAGAAIAAHDVVLAVGDAPPVVPEGVMTIWVGTGKPPTGVDHVLSLGDDPHALVAGDAVLTYHLLWELTHVCLEHPGLVSGATANRA